MRAVDVIQKKRDGVELSFEEMKHFINGYVAGEIPDYQASAFMMACCFQPLSPRETADLTEVMRVSGDTIDFSSEIPGYTVDKHSTGGVGDKTTLVLGPLVAACGVVVAKMSGRGLGHTGGTLDKLEAVKGLRTELERSEFIKIVNEVGIAVCGQTGNVVPADKKLYTLRDVTATVEDTALIAASIMSKKLAISNKGLVLDVKTGKGAFMKTMDGALGLAKRMVEIGTLMNRDVIALVTEMGLPLGSAVGNALEVREAVRTLEGEGPEDLLKLCVELGAPLLMMGGIAEDLDQGRAKIREAVENGSGLERLERMVVAQGGSVQSLHNLVISDTVCELESLEDGWIEEMDALSIGLGAMKLGAGRETKDDIIDLSVGLEILKKVGDRVRKGESLMRIYYRKKEGLPEIMNQLREAIKSSHSEVKPPPLILAEVTDKELIRFD